MFTYQSGEEQFMKGYETILVALDFSVTDVTLLAYVKQLNTFVKPKKIIFLNVHSEIDLPNDVAREFSNIKEKINKRFVQEMVAETTPLNLYETTLEFLALEGDVLPQILETCKKEKVDLLVIGKKDERKARHVIHKKLIRKVPCHVFVVPETAKPAFKRMMVATDFSDHTALATEVAIYLRNKAKAELVFEHIYEVPQGYHKTGKSYTEFASIMKSNAQKAYEGFHAQMNLNGDTSVHYTLDEHDDIGKTLLDAAKRNKSDLLVCGSKGKSNLSAVLLGSVSESLVEKNHSIPLLIVKKENEAFHFWKSFYNLE